MFREAQRSIGIRIDMREILPNLLWTGGTQDLRNMAGLLDQGVEAVVDLAINEPPATPPREMIYCRFPIHDGGENNPAVLRAVADAASALLEAGLPTLIACSAGMSRSLSIAAIALSRHEAISADEALGRIAATGPSDVSPALWADIKSALRGGVSSQQFSAKPMKPSPILAATETVRPRIEFRVAHVVAVCGIVLWGAITIVRILLRVAP